MQHHCKKSYNCFAGISETPVRNFTCMQSWYFVDSSPSINAQRALACPRSDAHGALARGGQTCLCSFCVKDKSSRAILTFSISGLRFGQCWAHRPASLGRPFHCKLFPNFCWKSGTRPQFAQVDPTPLIACSNGRPTECQRETRSSPPPTIGQKTEKNSFGTSLFTIQRSSTGALKS